MADTLPLSPILVSNGDEKLARLLSVAAGGSDMDDIVECEARIKSLDGGDAADS